MAKNKTKSGTTRGRKSEIVNESEKAEQVVSAGTETKTGNKRFEIDIFRDWCKSCGICASFCPRKCIELDEEGSPSKLDSSRCTGCGWCEMHCPDFAISVHHREGEP